MLKRTHTCGELREADIDRSVVLNGWVHTYRNQGSLIFIDLRDRYGITQVVIEPEATETLREAARQVRSEYVLGIRGTVARRLPGKENPHLTTGQVEVKATELV